MKATTSTLVLAATGERKALAVWCELIKARLTFLVLLTTLVGFRLGSSGAVDYGQMFHLMLGTGLLAASAAALNQWLEREHDARMRRTADRPLPAGRIQPRTALIFGAACGIAGTLHLAFAVNLLTCLLGVLTLTSYLFIYTPLKRVTWTNTLVGAIPGGLPPLMGWTAARGEVSVEGGTLFAILCVWQLSHFLAIAWLYREDYARASFVMLSTVDLAGRRTARQTLAYAAALGGISLLPFFLHLAGEAYLFGALGLGVGYVVLARRFARRLDAASARWLFVGSIIYLPLLLGLMVADRVQ